MGCDTPHPIQTRGGFKPFLQQRRSAPCSRHKLRCCPLDASERPLSPNHCSSRPYCQRGPIRLASLGVARFTTPPSPRYQQPSCCGVPPHPHSQIYGLAGWANLRLPSPCHPTAQHSRDQTSKTPSPHAHPRVARYLSAATTAQPTLLVKGCTVSITTVLPVSFSDSSAYLNSFNWPQ
jgi:hypothetical protein